jgi:hypothetical protein
LRGPPFHDFVILALKPCVTSNRGDALLSDQAEQC